MLIAIHSFGSIWTTRCEIGRTAYYNTTGVLVGSVFRHRSCIYGHVRMNATLGFHPDTSHKMLNRVFEADPLPNEWNGKRKLFLRGVAHANAVPELYLVALSSDDIGVIDRRHAWMCERGSVLSFSDRNDKQQALVLLPAYGWIQSATGTRYLIPKSGRPSEVVLQHRQVPHAAS